MATTKLASRAARFAELFTRYGVARRSAIEAGYPEKSADTTAQRLLKDERVQVLIRARNVNREVHAEETLRNLIALANHSIKLVQETSNNPEADIRDKCLVTETAGRAFERLAKCYGMFSHTVKVEGTVNLSLQDLAAKAAEWRAKRIGVKDLVPVPLSTDPIKREVDAVFDVKPIETEVVPPVSAPPALPTNGEGNGNGLGHDP